MLISQLPRYLIVAQPKSASTSLLSAIAALSGMRGIQQFHINPSDRGSPFVRGVNRILRKTTNFELANKSDQNVRIRDAFPAIDYPVLRLAHSDFGDFGMSASESDIVVRFSTDLIKQHFPPTEANLKIFSQVPKIILVRDVGETIESYTRVPTPNRWRELLNNNIFRNRLADDLNRWQVGWVEDASCNNNLIVEYKDFLSSPVEIISDVMNALGLEPIISIEDLEMPKERYYL